MTRRARSDRALATIVASEAIAIGIALAGCIGQVSAHPIGHPAEDAGPVAVPAATEAAPPFVCGIMDMDAGVTDGTPVADRTSRLLATGP